MDAAAAIRAADGRALSVPRRPQRGRSGSRRAATSGASVEVHEWRAYQPGDDVRSMDWNAVARTGELIVRFREDEISPRVEVVLDGSRSMAIHPAKAARARELALLLTTLAPRQGWTPTLLVPARRAERATQAACARLATEALLDAEDDLGAQLRRAPPLRPCGLRLVISDFLFETSLDDLVAGLARGASALGLIQLLGPDDVAPPGGFGARLVDCESEQALEHLLTPELVDGYLRRLAQHQALLGAAAQRARAVLRTVMATEDVETLAARSLFPLVIPARTQGVWP